MKPIEVNEKSFDLANKTLNYRGLTSPSILFVYANWCGHCRRFAPMYNDAAKTLGTMVKLFKIDSDKNPAFIKRYGVRSFPTIYILGQDGKVKSEYNGSRASAREFSAAICKLSLTCRKF